MEILLWVLIAFCTVSWVGNMAVYIRTGSGTSFIAGTLAALFGGAMLAYLS